MLDEQFLKILRDKLAYGSTKSALLNCIPGVSLSKIDACDLNLIQPGLPNEFVKKLLSEESFSFNISFQNILEEELEEERKLELERLSKRLNRVFNDNELSFQEKGHKTFGFGYPIFVMEIEDSWVKKKVGAKEKEKRLICAPLFIWPLEIQKSYKQNRNWTISKLPDTTPFINDTFISFIKQKRQVDLNKTLGAELEDVITYDSLQKKVEIVVTAINTYEKETKEVLIPSEYIFPLHGKEELRKKATVNGFIEWAGVFSLYSKQKQNLINEIDQLIEKKEEFVLDPEIENEETLLAENTDHGFTAIDTDHSQQVVINQLSKADQFIIQGPPGTGKSQTLTALITNALSNGLKCLVVCEKTTALEVIYNNLSEMGLSDLCAIIKDPSSKDRQKIVEKVRSAPLLSYPRFPGVKFKNLAEDIQDRIKELSKGYESAVQMIWEEKKWSDMLGEYLRIKKILHNNPLKNELKKLNWQLNPEEYKQYQFLLIKAEELTGKNIVFLEDELNDNFFKDEHKSLTKEKILELVNDHLSSSIDLKKRFDELPDQYEEKVKNYFDNLLKELSSLIQSFFDNYEHLERLAPDLLTMSPSSLKDYLTKITSIFSPKTKRVIQYRKELVKTYSDLKILTTKTGNLNWKFIPDPEFIMIKVLKDNLDSFKEICEIYKLSINTEIEKAMKILLNHNKSFKEVDSDSSEKLYADLSVLIVKINESNLYKRKVTFDKNANYYIHQKKLNKVITGLNSIKENLKYFSAFYDYQRFYVNLTGKEKEALKVFIKYENPQKLSYKNLFDRFYLENILMHNEKLDLPKDITKLETLYIKINELKKLLLDKILSTFSEYQVESIRDFRDYKSLYNLRGGGGQRRNSLRQIVNHKFNFFTNFFPIVLTNPTACATLFPLKQDIFDFVIFDEASQLRLEDTYSSLLRGKVKVISGDQHQMPPPRTYEPADSGNEEDEKDEINEDEEKIVETNIKKGLANSESLLDYVITKGYKKTSLLVHYRSNHPALIEFSNNAFYSGNLLPIIKEENYIPIKFYRVDGLYTERTNPSEADKAIEILDQIVDLEKGICPTVGIATFNLFQRDLIEEKITKKAASDKKFAEKIQALRSKPNNKALFVKNLENIQGDERDVIIMTTTFGKNEKGTFLRNFGPLNNRNGYRLLNVIITRAKDKVFICTSIPEEDILSYETLLKKQGKNDGFPIVMAYLAYAKAVSDNNIKESSHILSVIKGFSTEEKVSSTNSVETESPFEDEVYDELKKIMKDENRISSQKWIGPFRVDFTVSPKDSRRKSLVIECDGATYHGTAEAFAYDYFRVKQLKENGYVVHKIWSSNWWDEEEYGLEIKALRDLLEEYDADTTEGSLFYKDPPKEKVFIPIQISLDEFNDSNEELNEL